MLLTAFFTPAGLTARMLNTRKRTRAFAHDSGSSLPFLDFHQSEQVTQPSNTVCAELPDGARENAPHVARWQMARRQLRALAKSNESFRRLLQSKHSAGITLRTDFSGIGSPEYACHALDSALQTEWGSNSSIKITLTSS